MTATVPATATATAFSAIDVGYVPARNFRAPEQVPAARGDYRWPRSPVDDVWGAVNVKNTEPQPGVAQQQLSSSPVQYHMHFLRLVERG
jgi:hypothetical protein